MSHSFLRLYTSDWETDYSLEDGRKAWLDRADCSFLFVQLQLRPLLLLLLLLDDMCWWLTMMKFNFENDIYFK